ncbi:MAG: AMP-binding protein, partial [Acidimicrobiia bacterium]|nr:AMP-binding protein [Acidimicrobiia bacterium]
MAADTIPARLFRRAEQMPGRPAYHAKRDGSWVASSWGEYADLVRRAGKALIALGVQPDQVTTILGFNRPEWVVFDVATMAIGGAPAGIYTTNSPEEVEYITGHAEAPVILVENEEQLAKVLEVRDRLPRLRTIVTMEGTPAHDDESIFTWEAFLALADDVDDADFTARLEGLKPEGLATLIYTSGTTGPPKGVMLTHENLTWTSDAARGIVEIEPEDRGISYLPLSHIAEQMFTIHIPITRGGQVHYAESIDDLAENIKEVRPTYFFAVPRVWEKFHAGVATELGKASGVKAKIADWAQNVGRTVAHLRNEGSSPTGLLKLQHGLAGKLVHGKLQEALGFDEVKFLASGAAPISAEVLEFFAG